MVHGSHGATLAVLALLALALARFAAPAPGAVEEPAAVPVVVAARPLQAQSACEGRFVPHRLDHLSTAGEPTRLFNSNGSGLAVNDLDNDGDLDLVLANVRGPNTVLWNRGNLVFEPQTLPYPGARGAAIVDVEGDGWMDIVLTRGHSAPLLWRNQGPDEHGNGRFTHEPLPAVTHPAYTMDWGDLEGDGDLDLVTASYDAALMLERGNSFLFSGGAGVFLYENEGGRFEPHRLSDEAQALALALADLNGDGRLDVTVGNDFDLPDQHWSDADGAWAEIHPFRRTSHSTMSFDRGDIDNDGRLEWLATDMKPYRTDVTTLAAWLPLMEKAHHTPRAVLGPQVMENVLQVPDGAGRYRNEAYGRGVDATGWSWSAKFGDLDTDGFLDLYVVNGMIAEELFSFLPGAELVEENQALRNDGRGRFRPAPSWGLGSTASGRGMSMADLDEDGDLDVVVNNLNQPAQLFENRLCGGSALEIDLIWLGRENRRALGAQLVLHTDRGPLTRDVRATSGYLSGDPARIHLGFPAGATLHRLEIVWPDGRRSLVESPTPDTLLTITR